MGNGKAVATLMELETTPQEWVDDIEYALYHPKEYEYSMPSDDVIPPKLESDFSRFHNRAVAHSRTKLEHEAMALFNTYVVWKYKLWKARYKAWEDYFMELSATPFSFGHSDLYVKFEVIGKLVDKGVDTRNAIEVISIAPGATKRLVDIPIEALPDGDINVAVTTLSNIAKSQGKSEAIRATLDWQPEETYQGNGGEYIEKEGVLILKARVFPLPPATWYIHQLRIEGVESRGMAEWICAKLGVPVPKREYR